MTTNPTPSEWDLDRAVCEKATPGEWEAAYDRVGEMEEETYVRSREGLPIIGTMWHDGHYLLLRKEDAEFIARARTRWPAALDEIDRLRKELNSDEASYMAEISELKKRVAELDDIEAERNRYGNLVHKQAHELDELRQRVAELELGLAQKDTQVERWHREFTHACQQIAELERESGEWNEQHAQQHRVNTGLAQELTHARAVVEAMRTIPYSPLCDLRQIARNALKAYDDYMAKQGGGG